MAEYLSHDVSSTTEPKSTDKTNTWLRRITILLAVGCVLLVFGDVLQKVLDIARTSSDKRVFAILSARDESFDAQFKELSGPQNGLTYVTRDSDYGRAALKDSGVTNREEHEVWLVTIPPKGKPTATGDMNAVQEAAALANARHTSRQLPYAACVVLGGLLFGFLFNRIPKVAETLLLMVAFSASAYKWIQACPICEPVRVFGYDSALIGTVLYGVFLLGTAWPPFARYAQYRSAAFAGIALWQLLHFVVLRDPACPACFTVLFANSAMVSVGMLAGMSLPSMSESIRWKPAAALSAFVCFALTTLALTRPAPISKAEMDARILESKMKATGMTLAELHLPPSPEAKPHLELVVFEGCAPCTAAKDYFSRKSYPLRIVEMYLKDTSPSGKYPSFQRPLATPLGAPTLLGVDAKGVVQFEMHGWSSDEKWQSGLETKIASFLDSNRINGGKQ